MAKNPLNKEQILTLAEMMYMFEEKAVVKGEKLAKWKDLPAEGKDLRIEAVKAFVDNIAKIGFELTPDGAFASFKKYLRVSRADLELFLKTFNETKIKTPKGLANIYPHAELAAQILAKYGPQKSDKKDK